MRTAHQVMTLKLKELQKAEPKAWQRLLEGEIAEVKDCPVDILMVDTVQEIWRQLPGAEEALENLLSAIGEDGLEEIPLQDLIRMLYPEEAAEENLREYAEEG